VEHKKRDVGLSLIGKGGDLIITRIGVERSSVGARQGSKLSRAETLTAAPFTKAWPGTKSA